MLNIKDHHQRSDGTSTSDQVFNEGQILEMTLIKEVDTQHPFIDFIAVIDSANRFLIRIWYL